MTKQVALSDEAYAALRQEKRTGESFSRTVLRLLRTKQRHRNDVEAFIRFPHRFTMDPEALLQEIDKDRDADTRDPWEAHAGP